MDESKEAEEEVAPEASLGELSDFLSGHDISRLEAIVEANIGKASDGKL